MTTKFSLEVNLDDETEAREWIAKYGTTDGRRLANLLGFTGKDSARAADALSNYAWNKTTAIDCRKRGTIQTAQNYERICDDIYARDIEPLIACW